MPGDRAAIPTPPADADDDVRLVERAQSGDRDAWTILVQRHQDRVYSMCVRMVNDRELASDLAQDTFVKLIQGINSFDGRR